MQSCLIDYIADVVDNRGKTPPLESAGIELIEVNAFGAGQKFVDFDRVKKFVSEETFKTWFRAGHPIEDDVLITTVGAIGRIAYIKQRKGCIAQNVIALRPKREKLIGNYLYYYLADNRTQNRLGNLNIGVAQPSLKVPHLLSMTVSFPALPTQKKIAAILSAYDDLIENNERRIRILEDMAQNLCREWFVKFRFPGHEKVKLADSPMGKIPEGWKPVVLGDLCNEIRRSVAPSELPDETPYIGLEHMPRKSIALSEWGTLINVQSTKLKFKAGEILFGKIRPYFHKVGVAITDGVCSTDAIVIIPKKADYFGMVLGCVSSDEFVAHATRTSQGTKMPRANWDVLTHYPLYMPSDSLTARFNTFMENTVAQIRNLALRNRVLRQTRDMLLPRLISGELDLKELDIRIKANTTERLTLESQSE